MDISGTQLRAVRAALFTALVVTLSTASHVLLSRAPLPLSTVAVVAAAVFALAYALAGRERGFGRIAALLIPLELAADTVFTTGQHVCYGAAGGPVAGPLRSVGLDVLCGDGTSVGAPLARMTGSDPERLGGLLAHADRDDRLAAAGRAPLCRPPRGRLAAPRRAGPGPAAAGGDRDHLPAAAAGGRRGDGTAGAVRTPPAAPRPPYRHRARADPRALPGTAWTAVLGSPSPEHHQSPIRTPAHDVCASLYGDHP